MPQFDHPMRDADVAYTDPHRDQKPRRGRPPGTGRARGPAQRPAAPCADTKRADSPAGAEATAPACASVRSVFTASLAIRHGAGAVLREALRQTIVNCFSRRGARVMGNLDALRIESASRDLTVDDQLELVDELHLEITVDAIKLGDITSPGSAPPPQASPSRRILLGHPRVLLLLSRWRWQMAPAAVVLAALADPSSEPLPDRRPLP